MTLRGKAGAYGMPCLIEIFIGDLGCESLSPGAELREVHWVHPHPRKKPNLCCCRHTSTTCAPPRLQALHPQGAQQQANSKFSCPQDPASHSAKYCTPIIVFHEHILYHIYCVQHPLISIRLYICFSCCMMRTSFLSPTHASSSFVPKKASRAFGSSLPWTMWAQDIWLVTLTGS